LVLASAQVSLALPGDDFNDNTRDPMWSQIVDGADLQLAETNQRLEFSGNKNSVTDLDALYLSDGAAGFALSTAADFKMKVSFNIFDSIPSASRRSDGNWRFALDFGFGTTAGGEDSFAAAIAWAPVFGVPILGVGYAYRVDDVQTVVGSGLAPTSGTIYLQYTTATDTITLSLDGYDDPTPTAMIPNLVRAPESSGGWNANSVLVAIGARGHGVDVASGTAWLDNFSVDQGVLVPEPATGAIALLGIGTLTLSRARYRR
jgi:hypothetical protein